MATAVEPKSRSLSDPELVQQLQRLRKIDNVRNLLAVAQTWLIVASAVTAPIVFDLWRISAGVHWAWDIPVFAIAIIFIGAGQHQLTALGHEASHHILLTNRLANELVSDWLCMYPLFTTTHHYRLQHLAHHQFVNDPERDPNFGQLQVNGHWTKFPISSAEFWRQLFATLLPWNLLGYLRAIALYNSLPTDSNPYQKTNGAASKTARRVGVAYFFVLMVTLVVLTRQGNPTTLLLAAAGIWAGIMAFYWLIPDHWYFRSRIHPTISMRWVTLMRLTLLTAEFTAVAYLSVLFGPRVLLWFALLWLAPLATSFSFFMMMRQLVQHANGDRGWLTNTRVMFVNRFIRGSILPYGQDYHLPHHLYATVPHYNLGELHDTLMKYPEYREQALVVAGAVIPKPGHEYPTMVEMLGPDCAPAVRQRAFIDNSVLENLDVDERDEILKAGELSVRQEPATFDYDR